MAKKKYEEEYAEQDRSSNRADFTKKLLTSEEAAQYLGIEYSWFRLCRNKGVFGRDNYPAPKFICIGNAEKSIRYRVKDLDEWLEGYPSYTTPTMFFKATGGESMRNKTDLRRDSSSWEEGR